MYTVILQHSWLPEVDGAFNCGVAVNVVVTAEFCDWETGKLELVGNFCSSLCGLGVFTTETSLGCCSGKVTDSDEGTNGEDKSFGGAINTNTYHNNAKYTVQYHV